MFWVFTGTGGYLDASGSWGVAANRGVASTAIFLGANVAALLLVIGAVRRWREDIDLWLWLVGRVHRRSRRVPVLRPLLLAGRATVRGARGRARWHGPTARFGSAPPPCRPLRSSCSCRSDSPRTRSSCIATTGSPPPSTSGPQPGDRIFVWGQFPQAYWASDRRPATRFLTAGFLTGSSGGRSSAHVGMQYAVEGAWDDFKADLAAHPPDAHRRRITRNAAFEIDRFPVFDAYLHANYEPVGGGRRRGAVQAARRHAVRVATWNVRHGRPRHGFASNRVLAQHRGGARCRRVGRPGGRAARHPIVVRRSAEARSAWPVMRTRCRFVPARRFLLLTGEDGIALCVRGELERTPSARAAARATRCNGGSRSSPVSRSATST